MAFCRIPVHRFAWLRLLTCRASIDLRPIEFPIFCPNMEPPEAALRFAGGHWRRQRSALGDAKQLWPVPPRRPNIRCRRQYTSKGRRVRVSFRCAAPPISSYLYYDFPDSTGSDEGNCISVVAAHGELVLLQMHNPRSCSVEEDYFVYRPAGARRPPSLSLLPVPDFPIKPENIPASYFDPPIRRLRLDSGGIGLLRRGENNLLVVHLELWHDWDAGWQMEVFCVLRPGMPRWELMPPVPVLEYGGLQGSPRNLICVGDRFLCCICYGNSFLLFDTADEVRPKVPDVGLPAEVGRCSYGIDDSPVKVRRMGAAGDSSVRLVSIHPNWCSSVIPDSFCCSCDHDCCCRDGGIECCHPRYVFTIKTWKMNLSMDEPLEWVEDGEIDSEEIWALPGYEGLPQAMPEWPVVCLDEPNVICFVVSNYHFTRYVEKKWMVQLNITTKTILSAAQLTHSDDYWREYYSYHLPAEF